MNIVISDTYEQLSKLAADDLVRCTGTKKDPLVCTASGDSPAGLYRELVARVQGGELDLSQWNFVGLDEWAGMNGQDEGSCRYHLDKQFFIPLQIKKQRICFFDGRASDPEEECRKTDAFIKQHKGIDVAIIGLGLNGHVGMNEPGTSPFLHAHVAEIDPETQQVGQKYFTRKVQLSHGLTLGIANLMEARQVMLIVSGAKKAHIVQRMMEEKISEQLPATLLRNHPGFTVYLDKAAASLLSTT